MAEHLMLRGTPALEAVLASSYDAAFKAEAYAGNRRLGEVQVSASSLPSWTISKAQVSRRVLSIVLTGDNAVTWFSNPAAMIRAYSGALVAGVPQYIPVHWGVSLNPLIDPMAGTVTISSPDLGQRVVNDTFVKPTASVRGATIVQQIGVLVHGSISWVAIDDQTGNMTACPHLTWDVGSSRVDAISTLATAISAEAFFGPDGTFVIRPLRTSRSRIDYRVTAGVNMSKAAVQLNFQDAKNAIVATNQSASGAGVYGYSEDDDPTSPLYVKACGRNRGDITNAALTTNAQAAQLAYVTRMRLKGYPASVTYDDTPHPGVECGDVHQVHGPNGTHTIIPASINCTVGGSSSMSGPSATFPLPVVS